MPRFPSFVKSSRYTDMEKIINKLNSIDISKYKVVDGSILKIIAVVTMLFDHIGMFLLSGIPLEQQPTVAILGRTVTLYFILRKIGRIAFPIYCFLLTEGYIHTHNRFKYGRNLFIFAVLSEIPWNYAHTLTWRYDRQNVFFTLFLGYLGICCFEKFKDNRALQIITVAGLLVITNELNTDYGIKGYALILLIYALRDKKLLYSAIGTGVLNEGVIPLVPFAAIGLYNGKRGFIKNKPLKYAFYLFYPVHLFVLGYIRQKYLA